MSRRDDPVWIPEVAVEAAAQALCRAESIPWSMLAASQRYTFRADARAALQAAVPRLAAHVPREAIQWGVQWDSKGAGPWGERPWHPVEWCEDQETARAVVATAQRPWTNPRVVKRVSPSEWETELRLEWGVMVPDDLYVLQCRSLEEATRQAEIAGRVVKRTAPGEWVANP